MQTENEESKENGLNKMKIKSFKKICMIWGKKADNMQTCSKILQHNSAYLIGQFISTIVYIKRRKLLKILRTGDADLRF